MKTIIKGAIYKDGENLVRAHFSGEYWMVDATEFKTVDDIRQEYHHEFALSCLNNTMLVYDGIEYFECESSPHHTEGFELLSDISELEFYDYQTEF